MKAEDIIEGLNKYICDKRKELGLEVKGHFVLQRSIIPNATFKVYKTYKAVLWYIQDKKADAVIKTGITAKVVSGQKDVINRELNINLCSELFKFLNDNINNIIKGEFTKDHETIKI